MGHRITIGFLAVFVLWASGCQAIFSTPTPALIITAAPTQTAGPTFTPWPAFQTVVPPPTVTPPSAPTLAPTIPLFRNRNPDPDRAGRDHLSNRCRSAHRPEDRQPGLARPAPGDGQDFQLPAHPGARMRGFQWPTWCLNTILANMRIAFWPFITARMPDGSAHYAPAGWWTPI